MPKGYLIAHISVTDAEGYDKCAKAAAPLLKQFGAKAIARSGRYMTPEGEKKERHVVFEFPTYDDAVRFYECPDYQAAKALRDSSSSATFVLVEGTE